MNKPASDKSLELFQGRIEYRFKVLDYLRVALTHSSGVPAGQPHNERFEFLGDRVLGLAIADLLLKLQPDSDEGGLARALNALVRKEACVTVARAIELGALIQMDGAEARAGGRDKKGMLGDACEALIAAIYLDGGLKAAEEFIAREWADQIEAVGDIRADAKSALQEWAHARFAVTPEYETAGRTGPDHAPTFSVDVTVGDLDPSRGVGSTKRDAEQVAAEALLRRESVWI